jgi:2-phospho-L-lactate/phosphoenolpyruvate guanylyltransferase
MSLINFVIAVRGGTDAKSRLGPDISGAQRSEIVQAMLEDMLDAIQQSQLPIAVYVVTPTLDLAQVASSCGATPILEPIAQGLNAAFQTARQVLSKDKRTSVYLPADLPFLTPHDVRALVALSRMSDRAVIIPACSDGGTGALVLPPNMGLPFCFGEDSLARHLAAAKKLGLTPLVSVRPGFGQDVDRLPDLFTLVDSRQQSKTAALFLEWLDGWEKFNDKAA